MMIMGERSINKSTMVAGWISRWKQLAGCFLLVSLLVSCSIENDIPYPIVEASIESMVVEGQRSADANKFVEATINKSARTVTIYVNDSVDITKLKITSLKITSGAELIPDSSACNNFDKFPTSGFASLDSIPMSSNTRMDFSKPVTFTLRTYQDYVWTVSVTQIIDRDIEVTGMTDYVVDVNSCIVSIFVKGQDLSDLSVSKLNIGGEYGDVQPDPTTVKDYSSSVKFNVKYSWEENYTPWTVIVYEDEEGDSGAGTSADIFPMVSRAYLKGSIQVGKTPEIEYAKENDTNWMKVPSADVSVSGTTFTATLSGLSASTTYKYRVNVDGTTGDEQTFTTVAAAYLENGSFEDWSQDGKQWNPWATGKDAFWGTGNPGAAAFIGNLTTPTTESVKGKAALLETKNAIIKLGAGNIFTGDFALDGLNGLLHFGRSFSSFPTALRLYYKYTPATIDMIGDNVGDLASLKGQTDMFQIYIALSDKSEPYEVRNNPDNRQLFDPNDANIIAYGEYTSSESVTSYKELEIPLEYRATNRTPKYIIIVASSSKYGDYYIGGVGSKLWLDEMELVYE